MSPNNELNIDQYKKYLSGTMTAEELSSFERKLELDPFAKEALEGFTEMEQPTEMVASISAIEEKIGSRTGIVKNATPVIPMFRIASIAAVLLAVIGGGFLVSKMLSNNESLAENNTGTDEKEKVAETKKDKENAPIGGTLGYKDTITLNFSDDKGFLGDMERDQEILEPDAIELDEEERIEDNAPEIEEVEDYRNDNQADVVEELESIPIAEFASLDKRTESYLEQTNANGSSSNITIAPSATPSEDEYFYDAETVSSDNVAVNDEFKKEGSSFEQGLTNYQNSRYTDATNSFGKSISDNQKVAESNYYLGLSYMNLNKDSKALKAFDNVIGSASSLKNNAKWYKASILLKKGKNNDAKILLQELIDTNSPFKQSAQEKLNTL